MYYVQKFPEEGFQTLGEAFVSIFGYFILGPDEVITPLDFVFGILIVIILLNVVIAIVSDAWAQATAEAARVFWEYRLEFILDVTGGNEFWEHRLEFIQEVSPEMTGDNENQRLKKFFVYYQ